MTPPQPIELAPPVERWQGRAGCGEALRSALLALAAPASAACRLGDWLPPQQVWCVDRHFADWPLQDADVQQALAAWLQVAGRRLQFIGLDFETTARRLPRFVRWRRDHAHQVDVWRPSGEDLPPGLRGLWAGPAIWQWQETKDLQLLNITNPVRQAVFKADIADFLQRCEPAWPVTTLGL